MMNYYQLRFWFEHGGPCIWGMNDKTKRKYGYAIKSDSLPISINLANEINNLEEEYGTYLDWSSPQRPSSWTKEQKIDFINRANLVYNKLKNELGTKFEIINEIDKCIY